MYVCVRVRVRACLRVCFSVGGKVYVFVRVHVRTFVLYIAFPESVTRPRFRVTITKFRFKNFENVKKTFFRDS